MESAWTIRSRAVSSPRIRGTDCPHSSHTFRAAPVGQRRPAAASLNKVSAAACRRGLGALAAIRHSVCAAQGWRDLHKALTITTSLRATAAATTLCGFPSFRSRPAKTFKSLLRYEATSAA